MQHTRQPSAGLLEQCPAQCRNIRYTHDLYSAGKIVQHTER